MIHLRYRQDYIGDRRYPLDNLKYKSDYIRRREERQHTWLKQKKVQLLKKLLKKK